MIEWNHIDEIVPEDIRMVLLWLESNERTHPHVKSLYGGYGFGWYSEATEYWYAGDNGAQKFHDEGQLTVTHWAELTEPHNEQDQNP